MQTAICNISLHLCAVFVVVAARLLFYLADYIQHKGLLSINISLVIRVVLGCIRLGDGDITRQLAIASHGLLYYCNNFLILPGNELTTSHCIVKNYKKKSSWNSLYYMRAGRDNAIGTAWSTAVVWAFTVVVHPVVANYRDDDDYYYYSSYISTINTLLYFIS